jgi:Tfp pilus assembly protein PilE
VTEAAVIGLRSDRWSRLVAKLRDDRGVGLVELLIALLVLNLGIFATLGAFTSGAVAIRNASRISTAAAVADKQMEAFRNTSYANIVASGPTNVTGADGRTYAVTVTVSTGSQKTGVTYNGSASVKVVTITVTDPANGNKVLNTSSSTFSRCNQAGLGSDSTPCQS